jgi:hypothetical protein
METKDQDKFRIVKSDINIGSIPKDSRREGTDEERALLTETSKLALEILMSQLNLVPEFLKITDQNPDLIKQFEQLCNLIIEYTDKVKLLNTMVFRYQYLVKIPPG